MAVDSPNTARHTLREPWLNFFRLFAHTFLALCVGFLYSGNVGQADGCLYTLKQTMSSKIDQNFGSFVDRITNEEGRVRDNIAFHSFSLMFLVYASMMVTVMVFPSEVTVLIKEHKKRLLLNDFLLLR